MGYTVDAYDSGKKSSYTYIQVMDYLRDGKTDGLDTKQKAFLDTIFSNKENIEKIKLIGDSSSSESINESFSPTGKSFNEGLSKLGTWDGDGEYKILNNGWEISTIDISEEELKKLDSYSLEDCEKLDNQEKIEDISSEKKKLNTAIELIKKYKPEYETVLENLPIQMIKTELAASFCGDSIVVNEELFPKWTPMEVATLLVHELYHATCEYDNLTYSKQEEVDARKIESSFWKKAGGNKKNSPTWYNTEISYLKGGEKKMKEAVDNATFYDGLADKPVFKDEQSNKRTKVPPKEDYYYYKDGTLYYEG